MPNMPQCLIRQGLSIVPTLKPTDHIPVLTDVVDIGPMPHTPPAEGIGDAQKNRAELDHMVQGFVNQTIQLRRGYNLNRRVALPSHRDDPHTSYAAADKARGRANHLRVASLVALYMYGPATSDEIAERLGVQREDIARRCTELLQAGKIVRRQTGTHHGKPVYHTRKSNRGCAAVVWYVTAPEAA